MSSADGLVEGLVPARKPTESRYVLRLLRAGFVHVYVPSPPPGMENWLVYRVTDAANLIEQGDPVFSQMPQPLACRRNGHNVAGMKLLHIPQAHKIDSIWIAYSANLWNDKLKAQNAANARVMQQVSLQGGSPHTFKPTAEALRSRVLECTLGSVRAMGGGKTAVTVDQDFPFMGMTADVESLANNLQRAAACHPKTTGRELAVVLRDPVGVTAELNALRLRRHQLLEAELIKPENAHPLNSDAAVSGLKQVFLSSNALNSYDKVSPLCSEEKFKTGSWPANTEWVPLTREDRAHLQRLAEGDNFLAHMFMGPVRTLLERQDLGRAIYPDHERRAAAWAEQQTQKSWADLAPHIDEPARQRWKAAFKARMKAEHEEPLARFEDDWLSAAHAGQTVGYFSTHFDPQDPNSPLAHPLHSPGGTYAAESAFIHQPAPFSHQLQERYLHPLDAPITSEQAVALRAVVGNQQSVFELIHAQLTGDPGDTGMRDKSYDFLKGVLGFEGANPALKKFSWIGSSVAGLSMGYLAAASGCLTHLLGTQAQATLSGPLQTRLLKLQALWGVHRTLELAAEGALQGKGPSMPVLLHMRVDAQRALEVLRARAGQPTGGSRTYIKRQRQQGAKVRMSLLTDTDTLRAVGGNADAAMADPGAGRVKVGPAAKTATAGLGTVALNEEQFLRLYAREASLGAKAVGEMRASLHSGGGLHAKTLALSMPGRLAVGSVLVQGLGLVNGLYALRQAGTNREVRDAWFGIFDSTAGTLGGLLEVWSIARIASVRALAGGVGAAAHAAEATSLSVRFLVVLANVAGAAGGVINAMGAWAKASDAQHEGNSAAAELHTLSGRAFFGTGVAGGLLVAGGVARTLVARGVGGAVVETIAIRVGAGGVLATVGGIGLTVSGIGLVLLGAGMAFQIGAVALTPTPVQRWLSRSYFGRDPSLFDWDGKRDDMFDKGDWASELKSLQDTLEEGSKSPAPKDSFTDKAKQAVGL